MILGEVERALLLEARAGIALTQDLELGPVLTTSIAACDAAVWEWGWANRLVEGAPACNYLGCLLENFRDLLLGSTGRVALL
jgi:hypothetical protein